MEPLVKSLENLTISELLATLESKIRNKQDEQEITSGTQGWDHVKRDNFRKTEFFKQYENMNRIAELFTLRHQTVQAIGNLPTEILSKIFERVQGDAAKCFPPPRDEEMKGYNRWISQTSHVCRRWRKVALGTPSLWRYIILDKETGCPGTLGMTFIDRANPLEFEINIAYDPTVQLNPTKLGPLEDLYNKILANRDRSYGLHISGDKENIFLKLLNEDLPLQSIHVAFPAVPSYYVHDDYGPLNSMPFNSKESFLFTNSSPIKRLSLSGFDAGPPAIFTQITHLSLLQWHGRFTSESDFLDFLTACPVLEYFYLQGDPYTDVPDAPKTSLKYGLRSVALPNLKRMEFWKPFGRFIVTEFLRYLVVPQDVAIVWGPTTGTETVTVPAARIPVLNQLPPNKVCDRVTSVIFQNSLLDVLTLEKDILYVNMEYALNDMVLSMIPAIPDFFRNIKSLTFADVDGALNPSEDDAPVFLFGVPIQRLFDAYLCLEKLELKCGPRFVRGLVKDLAGSFSDQMELHGVFPELRNITLYINDPDKDSNLVEELQADIQRRGLSSGTPFYFEIKRDAQPFLAPDDIRRAIFNPSY